MPGKFFTIIALFITITFSANALPPGDTTFTEMPWILHTITGDIAGTLTLPDTQAKVPVALIIAGSGPTNHNGNGPGMNNNCLQLLAHQLAENHIASIRFDKRGIGESAKAATKESDLRFDTYVTDAINWIGLLKKDPRFSKVIIMGHSEGALIGMLAAKAVGDGYISIAGAGRSADQLLKEQLRAQPQHIRDLCFSIIDSLKQGRTVSAVDRSLYALFRPSVQPYLINWFQYDPSVHIQLLHLPVLLIQGTNDLQVTVEDAKQLAQAQSKAKLVIITQMNHVLKIVEDDRTANLAAYNNPQLPISVELVKAIVLFIQEDTATKPYLNKSLLNQDIKTK